MTGGARSVEMTGGGIEADRGVNARPRIDRPNRHILERGPADDAADDAAGKRSGGMAER